MFYYDPTFLLIIPAIILAIFAQIKVQSTYAKYSKVKSKNNISGRELASDLLSKNGLSHINIERFPGSLTDHYDPRKKALRLSEGIHDDTSVAALGVVAHEVGHAIQDQKNYFPLAVRSHLVPVANFGTTLAFPLFFIGLLAGLPLFMDIGIVFFSLAVLFSVVTLPVEFNASKRAITLLSNGRYLTEQEIPMAKKVLSAAALTYIAATAMIVLNLLRLLILRSSRD
jgi:Zn-dependent membrane protease YugP